METSAAHAQDESLAHVLLDCEDLEDISEACYAALVADCRAVAKRAYLLAPDSEHAAAGAAQGAAMLAQRAQAQHELHTALQLLLSVQSAQPHTWGARNSACGRVTALRSELFRPFLKYELQQADAQIEGAPPADSGRLIAWLRELNARHIASRHPLFDYLQTAASLDDVKQFFDQEAAVDARFDDLVALAQIGYDGDIKQEFADNYADELGAGDPERAHSLLFAHTSAYVHGFGGGSGQAEAWTETLACANLQTGMALDRNQSWRLAGYLAAFEENAPDRCQRLLDACVRHGMERAKLAYLSEHVHADVGHAQGLFERVVAPIASFHPEAAREIAEGFCLRLVSSAAYCDALLACFVQRAARI